MIEEMNKEDRIEAIQNLLTRSEYTESTLRPLTSEGGQVQIDSAAVANLILHTVLNQLTIMDVLRKMLTKSGETIVRAPEQEEETKGESNA